MTNELSQLNKDTIDLINFAYKYKNKWHSIAKNKRTQHAMNKACKIGIIKINIYGQIKHI